jgi:DNA-binding FadR family transcriptional regulator
VAAIVVGDADAAERAMSKHLHAASKAVAVS